LNQNVSGRFGLADWQERCRIFSAEATAVEFEKLQTVKDVVHTKEGARVDREAISAYNFTLPFTTSSYRRQERQCGASTFLGQARLSVTPLRRLRRTSCD
jgi:hypothetical protein